MRTWRLGLSLLSCLLALACGGGSNSPGSDDDGGNSGSTITVRGGERIAWDQPVESPSAAGGYAFILYVDGAQMPMTEVRCADVRSAGGVACSGRLPSLARGSHRLELTASVNGFESPRSQALTVTAASVALQDSGTTSRTAVMGVAPAALATLCLGAGSRECHVSRLLASGLGVVTSVVTTETGLFFVEGGRHVRVMTGDALAVSPALTVDEGTRITALAVSPDYTRSRAVFVAWSEPSRDGGETLNVTRYREVAGIFGEGATIVTGLPLPLGGAAPIAIDDRGLVYVALPAMRGPDDKPDVAALSQMILRFDSDGSVPATNPQASPVIAYGYASPSSIVWDAVARRLWLSGTDPRWGPVSTLEIEGYDRADWPWLPSPAVPASQASSAVSALALTAASSSDRSRHVWLLQEAGDPQRAAVDPNHGLLRFNPVEVEMLGQVRGVAAGTRGSLLVVSQSGAGGSELWRLIPSVQLP